MKYNKDFKVRFYLSCSVLVRDHKAGPPIYINSDLQTGLIDNPRGTLGPSYNYKLI